MLIFGQDSTDTTVLSFVKSLLTSGVCVKRKRVYHLVECEFVKTNPSLLSQLVWRFSSFMNLMFIGPCIIAIVDE